MKPAVIVIDMVKDNCKDSKEGEEKRIVPALNEFLRSCREASIPVIFACDSFMEGDFIFKGRLRPHAIRGTDGAMPIAELGPEKGDLILEKRRFSAFYKTDLDQTLRTLGVDTVLLTGINSHFCVLATAFDALSNDFLTIILEDLSAAFKREIHLKTIEIYRRTAVYPLFRIMPSHDFLKMYRDEG